MPCICGETHAECVTKVATGRNIINQLDAWLRETGCAVLAVADIHTACFAHAALRAVSVPQTRLFTYDDPCLTPDEHAVEALLAAAQEMTAALEPHTPVALLAVGSGTLSDLTRYAAHTLNLPFYTLATAASMDGYTSSVAPLTLNGLKKTVSAVAPLGVLADADVFDTAPAAMTAAGFGDIVGKWTSTHDWELEHIMTGASYCPVLADEMRAIADGCVRGDGSAQSVMDALLRSGLVMQRAGHSKPASGSEHHLSHFWEMAALARGETPAPHGAKVGVATLASLYVNEWLLSEPVDWNRAYREAEAFNTDTLHADLRRIYGRASDEVVALWTDDNATSRKTLLDTVHAGWPAIVAAAHRNLPPRADIAAALRRMHAPTMPCDIHVSRGELIESVLYAHRIRRRFTVWKLADVLGLLPVYAERLADVMY